MTTLQMQTKETELIGTIINNMNNQDKLEAVMRDIILGGGKQAPCLYSVAELNERAQQAVADYEAGRNIIPHKTLYNKFLSN